MREKEDKRKEADKAEIKRKELMDTLERLAYKKNAMDVVAWIEDNRDASFDSLTYRLEQLQKKH